MNPTCASCRFFVRDDDDEEQTECRRQSPTVDLAKKCWGRWPIVIPETDWCGEHELAPHLEPVIPTPMPEPESGRSKQAPDRPLGDMVFGEPHEGPSRPPDSLASEPLIVPHPNDPPPPHPGR